MKENPFKQLWNWVSIASGILGLTSLAGNILALKGFVLSLVAAYQSIVYPTVKFLFSWLPFSIPNAIFDYCFLGVIVGISQVKGMYSVDSQYNLRSVRVRPLLPYSTKAIPVHLLITRGSVTIILWPVMVVLCLFKGWKDHKLEDWYKDRELAGKAIDKLEAGYGNPWIDSDIREEVEAAIATEMYLSHREMQWFLSWLGAILLGLVLVLIVNSAL